MVTARNVQIPKYVQWYKVRQKPHKLNSEHYINMKLSNSTKKNQAHAVYALTATVDRLQSELEINTQNVSTIANTQDQMLAQPEAYSTHYVPSVVSATTATTPSGLANSATDQRLDKIESMFQQFMQQHQNRNQQRNSTSNRGNSNNQSTRGQGDPNGPRRRWKY